MKRLLLFLSFVVGSWLIFSSYLYVDHLVNHPDTIIERYQIDLGEFDQYFNYVENKKQREKALEYAKEHGQEEGALMLLTSGFKLFKPEWKTIGFFKFLILPIIHPVKTFYVILSSFGNNGIDENFSVNPMVELIFKLLLWFVTGSFLLFTLFLILFVTIKFTKDALVLVVKRFKKF
ncbi:hypothetical protein GF385_03150 [Candidatus Dependentiae bacterium]|nr:hypothetical protein [Candidatus Dependentiae bacterium]